jgi:exodeoxyribonuclease VII large subunit
LAHFRRAPSEHVARHRRHLHQQLRELRASARRAADAGRERASIHLLVLGRTVSRAKGAELAKRRSELERLSLALAAHDPERTLARGYALVEDQLGEPLASAAAARDAGEVCMRFKDGTVPARVKE